MASDELLTRLTDSLETALRLTDGIVMIDFVDVEGAGGIRTFSEKLSCPNQHPIQLTEIEPRTFSFNAPFGACPECSGLGTKMSVDSELLIGDPELTLNEGVILPWNQGGKGLYSYFQRLLQGLARDLDFSLDTPWGELSEEVQTAILRGNDFEVSVQWRNRFGRTMKYSTGFEGVMPYIERKYHEAESDWSQQRYGEYLREIPCPVCHGMRLKPEVLAVQVAGSSISDVAELSLQESYEFMAELELTEREARIAAQVLREIRVRLEFLLEVGLGYLTMARAAGSLSGGEAQRIRLATQIGSGLTGVLYVLDEPSIGLHQRDNDRLLETLKRLRDLGNTVIVVEHDEDAIRTADYVVDLGPGAGVHGGEIVAEGTLKQVLKSKKSLTAAYLNGTREIEVPATRRKGNKHKLTVHGARANNLNNVTASLPLGTFTCITGVSGSGKSSFTIDTLYAAAARELNGARVIAGAHDKVTGLQHCDKVIEIDQSPIGRTPRSNPATYTGAFTQIRDWFAGLPESQARGYKPGRFSFNVKGGRCEACQGDGLIKIEMHFLPDVYVTCEECGGKRYNRETLEVKFKGHSIADVLDMTIEDAESFFKAVPPIRDKMAMLNEVGLGYIKVGQQATTLSGGEAQRVKLAKELSKRSTGQTLYILDEPTTGLHFEDVRKLLEVLHRLVDQGNSVVVIEHNLDVIKTADWVLDLGPDGGVRGGEIVAEGVPEDVALNERSYTGQYLKPLLDRATRNEPAPA